MKSYCEIQVLLEEATVYCLNHTILYLKSKGEAERPGRPDKLKCEKYRKKQDKSFSIGKIDVHIA